MGKIKEEKLTHYFLNNSNKKEDLCVKNLLEGFLLYSIYASTQGPTSPKWQ